ncbi:MAG: hypothetical protein AVDCRST_MAG35-2087 [uncultured Quadrisphaera sp.]|uniref:Uncharacterized protein n=1 Tax=uncultured Quadrisphaera sp. TaxID=904978 RepID=A0A6J4PY21_9ACTN|nr:MAG: hypothetical protein AVDCRST_MAG35-2087 [uncultured Quadrisphaera sp.]
MVPLAASAPRLFGAAVEQVGRGASAHPGASRAGSVGPAEHV